MPTQQVTIKAPNMETAAFRIIGTEPFVQLRFSEKAKLGIHQKHERGSQSKKGEKREAKNFQEDFEGALYHLPDGGYGIPASAFRAAMISACRLVGYQMTRAKLAVFVVADGYDSQDGTPLVAITVGEPQYFESAVRNATGVVDLRVRARWDPGWEAEVKINYDADEFSLMDISNLLARAGLQVGLGEGRPDSKKSAGMGWGLFRIASE